MSFNKTFNGLDNSNAIWSNVEKSEINNAKRDMIAARNLYMINQIILNSDNTRSKWRSEKYAWDQLSSDINQFMSAKMTEQWKPGRRVPQEVRTVMLVEIIWRRYVQYF